MPRCAVRLHSRSCQCLSTEPDLRRLNIEIVNTGTELMLGRTLNTHQFWLCRRLADSGYVVRRQVAVADAAREILSALRAALERAALVICTGGLGPTSDDLTREVVAGLAGRRLVEDARVLEQIERWFADRNRMTPPGTRIQALVPEGAIVLPNANGTAPGFIVGLKPSANRTSTANAWMVLLPGPPRELQPMFDASVLPWIKRQFPPQEPFVCRTLRTTGIGESLVQELLLSPLTSLVGLGLNVGYCARPGEVDVRLAARGALAAELITAAETIVRRLLGEQLYGEEEDSLEAVVIRELMIRKKTLVTAESCTGGGIASRITDVPGSSTVFLGGVVAYSNQLKQSTLCVKAQTLAQHGAVSKPTAREMAEGARACFCADYALATTGIAGPGGGTEAKPVGTVFIALATAGATTVVQRMNKFDRQTFKHVTSQQALDLLRREMKG